MIMALVGVGGWRFLHLNLVTGLYPGPDLRRLTRLLILVLTHIANKIILSPRTTV